MTIDETTRAAFTPIAKALRDRAADIRAIEGLVRARPGFRRSDDAAAIVLAFAPPLTTAAKAAAKALEQTAGVPIEAIEADVDEQLAHAAGRSAMAPSAIQKLLDGAVDFKPPVRGHYQPPPHAPSLEAVEDEMTVTIAASPDAGWPTLRAFFAEPIAKRCYVGMYQFTAQHVYKALRGAILADDDSKLTMTMHPFAEPIPAGGSKSDDVFGPDLLKRLEKALGARFDYARTSVGPDGTFGTSYHIKVAVADGKRFWLSSGNWQSSNLPPFDPIHHAGELPPSFARKYNRDYHAVVEHAGLARVFEKHLQNDYKVARAGEAPSFAPAPALIAPQADEGVSFAPAVGPTYFAPRTISRRLRVTPVLTPDNYASVVLELLGGAKERIWLQNQYVNLNGDGDFPEFMALITALRDRMKQGLDVRILCRDLMQEEKLDMLLALGFERSKIRFMSNTHTKTILVDSKRALLGSHNWSNEGTVTNRDASLLFDDVEVTKYFETIFAYDWERRGNAHPQKAKARLAKPGEAGSVPFGAIYDDPADWHALHDGLEPQVEPFPPQPAPSPPSPGAPNVPADPDATLALNGVDGVTGQYLVPPMTLAQAAALAKGIVSPSFEVRAAAQRAALESFGLPAGVDPEQLDQAGWGLVFAEGDPDRTAIESALAPLIARRKEQAGGPRFKTLVYKGESVRDWLTANGSFLGSISPQNVPYHLVLIGGPERIPWTFQYVLDLEYSVGRLALETPADYGRYAQSVVDVETAASPPREARLQFFGTQHPNDAATNMSAIDLVRPLFEGDGGPSAAAQWGYASDMDVEAKATKARFAQILAKSPALLFTASHGMGFPSGHDLQKGGQGALLMQDWKGVGQIDPKHYFGGADVAADADVRGMIAFFFGCFTAGCPERDSFPISTDSAGAPIAPAPFAARLPQRLLAHPKGGALAIIGHVDRAWGFSIKPKQAGRQIAAFREALARVMSGARVGHATTDFSQRYASLTALLAEELRPGAPPADEFTLVQDWVERNDAQSYVVLGDPAVRVAAKKP